MYKWTKERLENHINEENNLCSTLAEIGNKIKEFKGELFDLRRYSYNRFEDSLEYDLDSGYIYIYEGNDGDNNYSYRSEKFPIELLFSEDKLNEYLDNIKKEKEDKEKKDKLLKEQNMAKKESNDYKKYLELKEKYGNI